PDAVTERPLPPLGDGLEVAATEERPVSFTGLAVADDSGAPIDAGVGCETGNVWITETEGGCTGASITSSTLGGGSVAVRADELSPNDPGGGGNRVIDGPTKGIENEASCNRVRRVPASTTDCEWDSGTKRAMFGFRGVDSGD